MQLLRLVGKCFLTLLGAALSFGCAYFIYWVLRYGDQEFGSDMIWLPIFFLTILAVFGCLGGIAIIQHIWAVGD
jgi:hypothetical protein